MGKRKETVRGSNGGKKRAKVLTPERRREIAAMGGTMTWKRIKAALAEKSA